MASVAPTVRYLIISDDIRADETNARRLTLVGLVSSIDSAHEPPYPALHPEFCVYVQMTGYRGSGEGRIEVVHADTDRVLFRTRTRTLPLPNDPLEVVGVTFRIRGLTFEEPGLY